MLISRRLWTPALGPTSSAAAANVLVAWMGGLAVACGAVLLGHSALVAGLVAAVVGTGQLVLLVRQQRRRAGAASASPPAVAPFWGAVAGHALLGALLGAALALWIGPAA